MDASGEWYGQGSRAVYIRGCELTLSIFVSSLLLTELDGTDHCNTLTYTCPCKQQRRGRAPLLTLYHGIINIIHRKRFSSRLHLAACCISLNSLSHPVPSYCVSGIHFYLEWNSSFGSWRLACSTFKPVQWFNRRSLIDFARSVAARWPHVMHGSNITRR